MTNRNDDDGNAALPNDLGFDETIVSGRPVLLVQEGDFGEPPPEWEVLDAKREMLRRIFPSVGRLGLDNGAFIGTAFLAGDGVLMTNRHVLQGITRLEGAKLVFNPGVTVRIDYRERHEPAAPGAFHVSEVLGVHREYDLALLRVDTTDAPPALTLANKQPGNVRGEVAVIGYPTFDSGEPTDLQNEIFQGIFGVKRLQPGKGRGLRGNPVVLGHDCSTLGGNSGSCVIDLETGHVIALHFGGTATTGNQAVPLWNLTDDSLLRRFELNWADEPVPSPRGSRRRTSRS